MAPVQLMAETSGQLGTFDTIGVLVDMIRHLPEHGRTQLNTLVPLITTAMREGRTHVGVTDDMRPYGFGIWAYVESLTHQNWLSKGPPTLSTLATNDSAGHPIATAWTEGAFLWFPLLLTPFTTPHPYLRVLRTLHPDAQAAWGLSPNNGGILRLW